MKCFIFLLFYNALDLNNQKILCLPSIFQFDRTGTNLNCPKALRICCLLCWISLNWFLSWWGRANRIVHRISPQTRQEGIKNKKAAKVLLFYIYTLQWNMKAVVSNGKFLTLHYLCCQEYVFKIPISDDQSFNL